VLKAIYLFIVVKIGAHKSLVLAPIAIDPKYQKSGVGKTLIVEGIRKTTGLNFHSINVLDRKDYYSEFRFELALQ
jgi:predicted N-acetyltransferase YhbS